MARPGLTGHRKFRRLVRALESPALARGALELLWDSCYESGDDYLGTSDDIEHCVGWTGTHGMLTRALLDAGAPEGQGFIEAVQGPDVNGLQAFRVHDLWHHAPDYVAKRRKRELDRQEKVDPSAERRRTASTDGQKTGMSDWHTLVERTPSPSPSPSPKEHKALRTSSAQSVVDLWNQLVTVPIPQATKLTDDRTAKINARLKAYPDLVTWRTVIEWVNAQEWCRAPGTGSHPKWTATIDWLCRSDGTIQRCLEKAQQSPAEVLEPPPWICPHTPRCPHRAACAIVAARTA